MCQSDAISTAALYALLVLQFTMLAALFTQTSPHPPLSVPPFAIAPFLGAAMAIAVAAISLGGAVGRCGSISSMAAAALSLVSFGPQKWIDPSIALIWPAVLLGQAAAAVLIVLSIRQLRCAWDSSSNT